MSHFLIKSVNFGFKVSSIRTFSKSVAKFKVSTLKCPEWSHKAVDCVKKSYALQTSVVCLNRPGRSPLTETLINTNAAHIVLWGRNSTPAIKNFQEKFPNKITLALYRSSEGFAKASNELNISGLEKVLILDHDSLSCAVSNFMREFVKNVGMWKVAPVDLLVFVNEDVCKSLQNGAIFCETTSVINLIFCNLFLNHKVLLEVPLEAFGSNEKKNKVSSKSKFLLSFSLKKEFAEASKERRLEVANVMTLMRRLNRKGTQRVIPLVESELCDGIGMNLIDEGIGMMDEVKDIQPHMWLKIIKMVISHPNFKLRDQILTSTTQECF